MKTMGKIPPQINDFTRVQSLMENGSKRLQTLQGLTPEQKKAVERLLQQLDMIGRASGECAKANVYGRPGARDENIGKIIADCKIADMEINMNGITAVFGKNDEKKFDRSRAAEELLAGIEQSETDNSYQMM